MRRIASTVATAALLVATVVACSSGGDEDAAPPSLGLTPGPGVSILTRPTESQAPTTKPDEPGHGNPPMVYGDCVVEVSRQPMGNFERITYAEVSCSEAAKKKPAAWKVVNLSGSPRFDCPDDARHISFTSGPLLSTTTEDETYVCAERL